MSGLTRVGRGERLLGAIARATVTYFIRWRGGCQRFLAANRWIGNRHAVTTVMRGKLVATSQQAGQLVARRTDEFVRRVADECERQVAELSARAAGPRGRVAVDRATTEAKLSGELNGSLHASSLNSPTPLRHLRRMVAYLAVLLWEHFLGQGSDHRSRNVSRIPGVIYAASSHQY